MIRSTAGTVRAWDGAVDLVVEAPPLTLDAALTWTGGERGLRDMLFETGIAAGPVGIEVQILREP